MDQDGRVHMKKDKKIECQDYNLDELDTEAGSMTRQGTRADLIRELVAM